MAACPCGSSSRGLEHTVLLLMIMVLIVLVAVQLLLVRMCVWAQDAQVHQHARVGRGEQGALLRGGICKGLRAWRRWWSGAGGRGWSGRGRGRRGRDDLGAGYVGDGCGGKAQALGEVAADLCY